MSEASRRATPAAPQSHLPLRALRARGSPPTESSARQPGQLVERGPGRVGGGGSGTSWWNARRGVLARWFRGQLAERAPGRVGAVVPGPVGGARAGACWRGGSGASCGAGGAARAVGTPSIHVWSPQEGPAACEGGSAFFHHERAPVARNGCASGLQPDIAAVAHRARAGTGVARRGALGEKTPSTPSRGSAHRAWLRDRDQDGDRDPGRSRHNTGRGERRRGDGTGNAGGSRSRRLPVPSFRVRFPAS